MIKLSRLQLGLLAAIGAGIALVIYFSSYALLAPFDYPYLENFYHKSQWQVPQSNRIMSDNELYQVAGVKLVEGAEAFSINPEVPLLGKYLYGWSVMVFGGPYWVSLAMFLAVALVFYFLAREVTDDRTAQLASVFLLITSPILMDQVSRTMLDLPIALCLLVHSWCVLRLLKQPADLGRGFKAWPELLGAGISLGLFAACKIPFFVPVILLADTIFMWRKQFKNLVFVALLGGLTYLVTYSNYFIQGNSLIEWARAQKWMVDFYISGGSPFVPFSNLITIFTGFYKDWWGQSTWHWTSYWSPVWVIGFVAMILALTRKSLSKFRYPAVLGLLFVLFQSFQPFWPRYYLVVLPLSILCLLPFTANFFKKNRRLAVVAALIFLTGYGVWFFRPSPESFVNYFNEDANQGDYLELYNYLLPENIDRDSFNTQLKLVDSALGVTEREVTLSFEPVQVWENHTTGSLVQNFDTPLGLYTFTREVSLVRHHNQWRLDWNWDLVAPSYQPGDQVQLQLAPLTPGKLISSDNQVLSTGTQVTQVYIDMSQIQDLETAVDAAAKLTGLGGTEIRKQLVVNALPNQVFNLGLLDETLPEPEVEQYSQVPGLSLVQVMTPERTYTPVVTQSQRQELVELIEGYHPELNASVSGQILLHRENVEPIRLFNVETVPTQDVRLGITAQQLLSL